MIIEPHMIELGDTLLCGGNEYMITRINGLYVDVINISNRNTYNGQSLKVFTGIKKMRVTNWKKEMGG